MSDLVLVQTSWFLGEAPKEPGGSADALKERCNRRVFRGRADQYPIVREETRDAAERRAEIDGGNHRG